jgi:hypothetical protein
MFVDTDLKDTCTLVLITEQGGFDSGYSMARHLRERFTRLRVVVPSVCKGAGMLIAMVADELIFGAHGELGPITEQAHVSPDRSETFAHYMAELARVSPNILPNAADRLISEGAIIDPTKARDFFHLVDDLNGSDLDAIRSFGTSATVPLVRQTLMRIVDDVDRDFKDTDGGEYPIFRRADMIKYSGSGM